MSTRLLHSESSNASASAQDQVTDVDYYLPGDSLHYIGIFEALTVAEKLELAAPRDVTLIVVEVADVLTVGGSIHRAVRAAVDEVADLAVRLSAA